MKIGTSAYIQDIAPTLAHCFIESFDCVQDISIRNAYYKRFNILDERFGLQRMRFGGHLHDSYVLSREKTDDRFTLWLNDVATCDLARALCDKKGLSISSEVEFLLGIAASDIRHLSFNSVNKLSGRMIPCYPRKSWQYIREEIISWDENGIEIAIDLIGGQTRIHRSASRRFSKNRTLLLIACGHLSVDECQDTAWRAYFGHDLDDYYNLFKYKRDEGMFVSDYTQCCKVIDEFDSIFNQRV